MAFNAHSKASIEVDYAKEQPPGDLPGLGRGAGNDNEGKAARELGEDKKRDEPAICKVKIRRQSDDAMKGVLCRAVILSDAHSQEFSVEVNQDHGAMQEAMKQRPVNRMALLAWIVAEIGKELPFYPDLLKRVVPRGMIENVLGASDEREQGRIVTRLLLDRTAQQKAA